MASGLLAWGACDGAHRLTWRLVTAVRGSHWLMSQRLVRGYKAFWLTIVKGQTIKDNSLTPGICVQNLARISSFLSFD